MNRDDSGSGAPLLGVVGWNRREWLGDYYPADLPPDWRLAYLANDCDCVMLPADAWSGSDAIRSSLLDEALAEAPAALSLLLQVERDASPEALARFVGRRVILLVERPLPSLTEWPQWCADRPGHWVSPEGARVEHWWIDEVDLRAWRDRAEALSPAPYALLLDGPAAAPARVRELRTLLQLLGIA